ncbi:MAG: hypothetical protein F2842_12355 [Actinobacteria bacterium]|uniref:Unannotated protein n=1 Tax=freshwater metagenome TaxID=449393 RepID=A0A6J7LCN5_9ZZZZ|nr:hypothetical protein [Actinomycetota bacterium]
MSTPETNVGMNDDQGTVAASRTRWKWVAAGVAAVVVVGGALGTSAVRSSNEGVAGSLQATTIEGGRGEVKTLTLEGWRIPANGPLVLDSAEGSAVDAAGNLYIAAGTRVQKITAATLGNTTLATAANTTLAGTLSSGYVDATGTAARFKGAQGVAVGKDGTVYVADAFDNRIRKITAAGVVTTLAGSGVAGFADGSGTAAKFNAPTKIAVDGSGIVYVLDKSRIRKITPAGVVTTLAGNGSRGFADGIGSAAGLDTRGIAIDRNCTSACVLYLADYFAIRSLDTTTGQVTTLAGNNYGGSGTANGVGNTAFFNQLSAITMHKDPGSVGPGVVWVADGRNGNPVIRQFDIASRTVTSVAGNTASTGLVDGIGSAAKFNVLPGISVTMDGKTLYAIDSAQPSPYFRPVIRKVT